MASHRFLAIFMILLALGCQRQEALPPQPSPQPPEAPQPTPPSDPGQAGGELDPQSREWIRTFSIFYQGSVQWMLTTSYVTPSGSQCLVLSDDQNPWEKFVVFGDDPQASQIYSPSTGAGDHSLIFCYSSQGEYLGSRIFAGDGTSIPDVVFDKFDNAYVAVNFWGHQMHFDPDDPHGYFTNNSVEAGDLDAAVFKLSPEGKVLWAQYLGGPGRDAIGSLLLGPDGQVYVLGLFDSAPFKVGWQGASLFPEKFPENQFGKNKNTIDVFIARLRASDGTPIDLHQIGGDSLEGSLVYLAGNYNPKGQYLAARLTEDKKLNLFIASDSRYLTLNHQKFTPNSAYVESGGSYYALQLSPDLSHVEWFHRIDGISSDPQVFLGNDATGVYDAQSNLFAWIPFNDDVTGLYVDGLLRSTSHGDRDYAFLKFNSKGQEIFYEHIGSSGWEGMPWSANNDPLYRFDPQNNLFVVAKFGGPLLFFQKSQSHLLGKLTPDLFSKQAENQPNLLLDWFIAKYSPQGQLLWKRAFATDGDESLEFIETDAAGNVYVVGSVNGQDPFMQEYPSKGLDLGDGDKMDYDPDLGFENYRIFIAAYDPLGKFLWKKVFRDDLSQALSPHFSQTRIKACRSLSGPNLEDYHFVLRGRIDSLEGKDVIRVHPNVDEASSYFSFIKFNPDGSLGFVKELHLQASPNPFAPSADAGGLWYCLVDSEGLYTFEGKFYGDLVEPYSIPSAQKSRDFLMKADPKIVENIPHQPSPGVPLGPDVLAEKPLPPDPPKPNDKLKLKSP